MQHSATPQQFCLRWNNYQSNLTNVFDQLLQSESFVDVTLACDGHSVKAHKMVLSACSPYFQSLFFDNPCQHPIVIMKDIQWPELKAVVEFMYKGEINVSQEQIGPLLKVAESLKIRGLADVNGDHEQATGGGGGIRPPATTSADLRQEAKKWETPRHMLPHDLSETAMSPAHHHHHHHHRHSKKRRRASGDRSVSVSSPEEALALEALETSALEMGSPHAPHPPHHHHNNINAMVNNLSLPPPSLSQSQSNHSHGGPTMVPLPGDQGLPLPLPPPAHADEMEIKPGIAEMIREEERAKLLESSQVWLGASTSSIAADSYQYQLQSMWQKCWNTNQSLVHNLRFRERGPLKSWRPETMAEAIYSVLKEGLSLSQAARKYDIPYPTFVLYANRVHNMLGPSMDGGADLRPKGRGRPQRILLGAWPEEHIRGVLRTVVFRDTAGHIKEESQIGYASPHPMSNYSMSNGPEQSVSPTSAAAAAVAAVAQGLRQQMCSMVAAAQHHAQLDPSLLAHCGLQSNGALGMRLPSSPSSPTESAGSPLPSPLGDVEVGIGVSGMTYNHSSSFTSPRPETLFQEDIDNIVKSPSPEICITKETRDKMMGVKLEPLIDHD